MGNGKITDSKLGNALTLTPAVDPGSAIGMKWAQVGGEKRVGKPLTAEFALADGYGHLQVFQRGALFWSPAFGAVLVSMAIFRKWVSPSVAQAATSGGTVIQAYLGYPTEDFTSKDTPSGMTEYAYFERGMIFTADPAAYVVYGPIYVHYRKLGGLTGFLGSPTSDEEAVSTDGRVSHFTAGDIYWQGDAGAHELHGDIRQRWIDLGGPDDLGYPITDEAAVLDTPNGQPSREVGRFSKFQGGSIYWSATTAAWEIYGEIQRRWNDLGGPTGALGFPTSGETNTPTSGGRFSEFEHGVIVWHASGPYAGAKEALDLRLVLTEFNVNEDFNVQIHITATPDSVNHGRMPPGGEYDGGSQFFHPDVSLIEVDRVRRDTVVTVWMLAIHEVLVGSDDRMGTITATYSVDNVWGLYDLNVKHNNGAFDAWFKMQPKTVVDTKDPDALFWPFKNTRTFKLSWENYARTFRDVKETDKHLNFNPFEFNVHPWEIFLYEAFYNSLAEPGACFGMCLEALYARDHSSLFVEPLRSSPTNPFRADGAVLDRTNPGDSAVLEEINVKHGYQIGAGFIEWFLGKWTAGALHDPLRAYWESYFAYQSGNWPLLTISDEDKFSQSKSHVLMPFAWSETDPQHADVARPWTILVKNVNFPLAAHDDDHCKIIIDPLTERFSYLHRDGETWTGSSRTGGRLLMIPFTELNGRPVTPGWWVLPLITAAVIIILADGAETEQITDGNGRTFFQQERRSHVTANFGNDGRRAINWDPATRIPGLMEIATFGEHGSPPTTIGSYEVYYFRPERPSPVPLHPTEQVDAVTSRSPLSALPSAAELRLTRGTIMQYQTRATRSGTYRLHVIAPRMSASLSIEGEHNIVDSIQVMDAGGHFQDLVVTLPKATKSRQVTMAVSGWPGQDRQLMRSFVIENLRLDRTQSIRARITDGGQELVVENIGPAAAFDLKLFAGLTGTLVGERRQLSLQAHGAMRVRPHSWSLNAPQNSPIELAALDRIGGKVLTVRTI